MASNSSLATYMTGKISLQMYHNLLYLVQNSYKQELERLRSKMQLVVYNISLYILSVAVLHSLIACKWNAGVLY